MKVDTVYSGLFNLKRIIAIYYNIFITNIFGFFNFFSNSDIDFITICYVVNKDHLVRVEATLM